MKRILIIKLWALGDVLVTTPVLRALKTRYPDCRISWLVDVRYAEVLRGNRLLDEIIPFDTTRWRRAFRGGRLWSYWRITRGMQAQLRARRFDVVLNMTGEKWWSLPFEAAPTRIGLFPSARPGWTRRFHTHSIPRLDQQWGHHTDHYLRAVEALGIPPPHDRRLVLDIPPEDRQAAREFLRSQPAFRPDKPWIVLHPGASQETKRWPPDYFAELARCLQERFTLILTGSSEERALAEAIAQAVSVQGERPIVAAGAMQTLHQTSALVEGAAAVVTGDTSLLHIASALETPVVCLYGSTRPGDYGPLFGPQALLFEASVPCAPCYQADCPLTGTDHLRCQRAVSPARVLEALETLLKEKHELSSSR